MQPCRFREIWKQRARSRDCCPGRGQVTCELVQRPTYFGSNRQQRVGINEQNAVATQIAMAGRWK